jgi:hypothetical protein
MNIEFSKTGEKHKNPRINTFYNNAFFRMNTVNWLKTLRSSIMIDNRSETDTI